MRPFRIFAGVWFGVLLALVFPQFASAQGAALVTIGEKAANGTDALGWLPPQSAVYTLPQFPRAQDALSHLDVMALSQTPLAQVGEQIAADLNIQESLVLALSGTLAIDESDPGAVVVLDGEGKLGLGEISQMIGDIATRFSTAHSQARPDATYPVLGMILLEDPNELSARALNDLRALLGQTSGVRMLISITSGPSQHCRLGHLAQLPRLVWGGAAGLSADGDNASATRPGELVEYLGKVLDRPLADPSCSQLNLINSVDWPDQEQTGDDVLVHHSMLDQTLTQLLAAERAILELAQLAPADQQVAMLEQYHRDCVLCLGERPATQPADTPAPEFATALRVAEQKVWQAATQLDQRVGFSLYLEQCQLCEYRDQAQTAVADYDARQERIAAEAAAFAAASQANELEQLQDYLDRCVECQERDAARTLVTQIQVEQRNQAERELSAALLARSSVQEIQDYLNSCEFCHQKEPLTVLLASKRVAQASLSPCLHGAGLPQFGGPRLLRDIVPDQALAQCQGHLDAYPDSAAALVALGRVAQSQGDLETALKAYDDGIQLELPAAFGLKAHMLYSAENPSSADFELAVELAHQGAALDDWLSRELLTVLYSQELVAGKGVDDALEQASYLAERGVATGHYYMGYFHLNGLGVPVSEDQAIQALEQAAQMNFGAALVMLGDLYEKLDELDKAGDRYWRALEARNQLAQARFTDQLDSRQRAVIEVIQGKLQQLGLYDSTLDGVAGPGTRQAIASYLESQV